MKVRVANSIDDLKHWLWVTGTDTKFLRGHTREYYELKPGIARGVSDGRVIEKYEQRIFKAFKRKIFCKGKRKHFNSPTNKSFAFTNEWEWYFQAQHCRLLTRLLDWTISWDTAVSFAVGSDPTCDDYDGAVWIWNGLTESLWATTEESDYKNVSPFELKDGFLIYPPVVSDDSENYNEKLGGNRLPIQHGKFSIQSYQNCVIPMEQQKELENCLEKIIIPSKLKKVIRKHGHPFRLEDDKLYTKDSFGIDEIANKINERFRKKMQNKNCCASLLDMFQNLKARIF